MAFPATLKRRQSAPKPLRLSPGWLFISPWLLGFLVFSAVPFIGSLYLSFCRYDILSSPRWVGLTNFRQLFFHDPLFWKALYNTLLYTVFAVPLSIVTGVALALLLNANVRGISLYRTIFFLPSIVPMVATSILWIWILNPQIGLINTLLAQIGISGPPWLASAAWSKPSLVIMAVWGVGGSMVIYLAGLKDIPVTLYEAAIVDGANRWHKMIHITLPMLTPVIFFNLVMGLIGSFQYFSQAYIMTRGGPADSTLFYCLYLFNRAFLYLNMGYASAMAWILFALVLIVTIFVFRSHTKWVHYE